MRNNADLPALEAFTGALLSLDRVGAARILEGPDGRLPPMAIVEQFVVPALDEIGRAWDAGRVALSQVYMSSRICEELIAGIPGLAVPFRPDRPRVAIAAIEDQHLLGKSMVRSMLRAAGFSVADYGVLDASRLAARARADRIDVLLVSVLMLRSALAVRDLCAALKTEGASPTVVVGGAPFRFDGNLWREVGADACGRTASDAVAIVSQMAGAAS